MPPTYPQVPASYPTPNIVLTNETCSKSLSIVPTIPNSSTPEGQYGEVVVFDFAAPETQTTINIKYVKGSLYESYRTLVRTPGTILTATTSTGEVVIGQPTGVVRKNLGGTELYELDISIRRTN